MKKEYKFNIVLPPGSPYLAIALGIVYDWKVALITLGLLTVLFTVLEKVGLYK